MTRDNDKLYLKVPPEGPWLELFPKSETSFFHIDLSGHDTPELEVIFHKDERGQATQLIAKLEGFGTVSLERALKTETTTSTEENADSNVDTVMVPGNNRRAHCPSSIIGSLDA